MATSGSAGESSELPIRTQPDTSTFDIVATYNNLLKSEPDLTEPTAAIVSLIELLNAVDSTTAFETLETLKAHADRLKRSVKNPTPLTAGTDLFTQYIVSSLKQQDGNFEAIRQHLLRNGRLFASRAIAARSGVAEAGWRFVEDGCCVLTHGASRCVAALLARAAKGREGRFRVVYVRDDKRAEESDRYVKELRSKGIPVAEIPMEAVAHVRGLKRQVDMVIVGAEAVTQDGGIISRMGTYQLAREASNKPQIPFYVAAETHKFVRKFPLGQGDLGQKNVLDFSEDADRPSKWTEDAVDHTNHRLIANFITENGIKLPSYVFEQLLDIYGSLARH